MKKLSSFLVLMLIALMLFVSCNGSTPTKEESNSSSTEPDATDADGKLTSAIYIATKDLFNNSNPPNNLTFNRYICLPVTILPSGDVFNLILVGSATVTGEQDGSFTYKYDLKDGTTNSESPLTVKASFTLNRSSKTIVVHEAIIDGTKVKNLGNMMMPYVF